MDVSARRNDRLQLVSPLPPLPTGIAQYSRDFLEAVDGSWAIDVFGESGSRRWNGATTRSSAWSQFNPHVPTVYQIGNSEFHQRSWHVSLKHPGIVVLHDAVLHHALFSYYIRNGNSRQYLKEVEDRYGQPGLDAAHDLLSGRIPENLTQFPLFEQFVEHAPAVVVHNRYAKRRVEQRFPLTNVKRIPMGIPLPKMMPRSDARNILDLPDSAFLIVSVSHINPQKRIPVLLRAVRRLRERVPEVQCIIAGTPSPGLGYERLVSTLGLTPTVTMPGYVSDQVARLLVAAADVCVNLRYPSNGETSASLLRMLSAARPVIVSGGAVSEDLPEGVGLKIPVDRFEEEMLADVLFELHSDDRLRSDAGHLSRQYIEDHHTIQHMVEGYRLLVNKTFDMKLKEIDSSPESASTEKTVSLSSEDSVHTNIRNSTVDRIVNSAIESLRLDSEQSLLFSISRAMVDLDLDKLPKVDQVGLDGIGHRTRNEILAGNLQCLHCRSFLEAGEKELICIGCGTVYRRYNGIPMFHLDQI